MQYYTIAPPKSLAGYVRHFWVLEGNVDVGQPYIHRCLADGCPELLFHYKGRFDRLHGDTTAHCFNSGIQGQSQEFKRFLVNSDFGMFGVYLYPFAIPELFGLASPEMANQMPGLDLVFGKTARELEEKMMLATDNLERFSIVCAFLESKLPVSEKSPPGVKETIRHIILTKGIANVSELAERNFLSTRQFERHFKTLSGFSPKLFSRIIRFQAATAEFDHKEKSLTEIAYDCGYYDQSHFIHDFKAFSGHHPKQYFSGKSEASIFRDL